MHKVRARKLRPWEDQKLKRMKRQLSNAVNSRHARMILRLGGGLTNGQLEVNGGSSPIRLNAATSEDIKIAVFNNTYFQGLIDEVQIYNRALSDTEIMGLAN